jgi:hypothetical protein
LDDSEDRQVHRPEKGNTVFTTFAAPKVKKKKHAPMYEILPAEQNCCVTPCIFTPDRELDCLTDSHIKLNSLDDMQDL